MTDLIEQADQPQVQYTAEVPKKKKYKQRECKPRGPYKIVRPIIEQPEDPTIRYIPLTRGFVAIVDTFLYEWLAFWNWYVVGNVKDGYYAMRDETVNRVSRGIAMHAQIMGRRDDEKRKMDHRDRNTMNNTGANLRYANELQSAGNKDKYSTNTSGFKGVTWMKSTAKWLAQIQYNRRNHNLGYYFTREEAARAYDIESLRVFGDFAYLNFPEEIENYRLVVGLDISLAPTAPSKI